MGAPRQLNSKPLTRWAVGGDDITPRVKMPWGGSRGLPPVDLTPRASHWRRGPWGRSLSPGQRMPAAANCDADTWSRELRRQRRFPLGLNERHYSAGPQRSPDWPERRRT